MSSDSISPTRVVALALVVGTLFTAQAMLTNLAAGRPANVGPTVVLALLFWVVWAFLTPLVLAAVRRWPLDAKPVYRSILLHAGVSVVLSIGQTTLALGVRSLALYIEGAVDARQALTAIASPLTLGWGVFTGVFFYWVIAVVHTALRFRGLYVSERLSAAALETALTRSELDALRSQLRPHFLFNTLNAISGLMPEDADKPQRMLLRLSSLLRRSLDEAAHEVPLGQELAFLNDYLDIQRVRFGSRLTVDLAIDPAVLPTRVPVFLLQPLLENAIEHGERDDGRTTIVLSAARDGDVLRLTVEDDGPGLAISGSIREGVGLRNTRARVHHLYGPGASVELKAAHGRPESPGARVEIRIPLSAAPA